MTASRRIVVLLWALASALSPFGASAQSAPAGTRPRSLAEDLQLFSQVLNQIRLNHPDTVDVHALVMAAIQGMIQAADPHSSVVPAIRLDKAKQEAFDAGKLVPLPITFHFVNGSAFVLQVAQGTRAAEQDILPGDVLLAVDGRPIAATSELELEVALAGPPNQNVTLKLERWSVDGGRVELERVVTREPPDEETAVPRGTVLDGNVGYLRITTFMASKVDEHLRARMAELERSSIEGLIIDLRDNGGGRVDQASLVASEFLPEGALIGTTEGRKKEMNDTIRVDRSFWRRERSYPVVVLVNENTASASELLSGALQDHDRALIVGRPTFGKALVMVGMMMSDGSSLTLVVGRGHTPCGRVIQRSYENIPVSRYYELAGEVDDTTGLPSCKSDSGRILYGGQGIRPDVILPRQPRLPQWLQRAAELDMLNRWAASWVTERRASLTDPLQVTDPSVASAAVTSFLEAARREGLDPGPDADTPYLRWRLVRRIALHRWGQAEAFLVDSRLDPEIAAAAAQIGRARELLTTAP